MARVPCTKGREPSQARLNLPQTHLFEPENLLFEPANAILNPTTYFGAEKLYLWARKRDFEPENIIFEPENVSRNLFREVRFWPNFACT